jgi:hypothetical protein
MSVLPRIRSVGLGTGFSLWLLLTNPRPARAEGAAGYKYEDYRESGGRIGVKTDGIFVSQDLGADLHVQAEGVIDAIAGATPNGQPAPAGSDQVVLTEMHDRRKAWNVTFSRQLAGTNVALGYAHSLESDYLSNGLSLNTITDYNEKNTELLLGIAGTDDRVKVFYQTPWDKKHAVDAMIGIKQLLSPRTFVTFNLSWERQSGYLSDPYKLVQKNVEVAPGVSLPFTYAENRPPKRTKWVFLAALNHAFPSLNAAIDASYRFYHDSYDTYAHTVELKWLQRLGGNVILEPELRGYDQTKARFYHYNLDLTGIQPAGNVPMPDGPYYSSDHRLSALRTYAYGLKVVVIVSSSLRGDVALEKYEMRGRDGITPPSAYPQATILNAGFTFSW